MLNRIERDDLEQLLDRYDMTRMLEALASIAHEKAEHLVSNWQDTNAAKSWTRDAAKLEKLAAKMEN